MEALYRHARLKIERAEKHIADFNPATIALENTCGATIKHRPDGGEALIHEIPNFRDALDRLSLIAGDVIHNLHSAMDFSWRSTIERLLPDKLSDHTKFPVRETRVDLEGCLHGIEIDTRCKPLFDCVVTQIQPYKGAPNPYVWALHDLDISDKHLLLLGFDQRGLIGGISVRDQNGYLHKGLSRTAFGSGGKYITNFETGLKVEEKGKLSVTVTLQEADIFSGSVVLGLLHELRQLTSYNINLLENVCC